MRASTLTKSEVLKLAQNPTSGLDVFSKMYSIAFDVITLFDRQLPLDRFIKFNDNEYFYLTGITASYDTGPLANSPKIKLTDVRTNKSLQSATESGIQTDNDGFFKIEGNFSPALETKNLAYIHDFDYLFAPLSQLKIEAVSGEIANTNLQLCFKGFAVREGKV